jgi:hypothetical protein
MACVYMAESVRSLPSEIQQLIEVREWDMRTLEGFLRFKELNVRSLPSLALNEELVFEALIPGQEELIREILARSGSRYQDI